MSSSLADLHARLLVRWGATRHPRIGDLCERVVAVRLAEDPRPPLAASKKRADLDAWNACDAKGDPLDFARLAAAARGGTQDDVNAHVAALAQRTDPAMAGAMLALLANPPYAGVKSRGMLEHILEAIATTRDRRAAEPARELGRRYLTIVNSGTGGWTSHALAALAEELAALPVPDLDAADAELVETLEARFGKREVVAPRPGAKTLAQLLDEVYAAPADDGPRQIYADALLEQNDPRGEWIALDLARARGELDAVGEARQKELATPGEIATWAQPLANGGEVTFARGFPAKLRLYRNAKVLIGARELATITELHGLGQISQKAAVELLASPGAANLRVVSAFSEKLLAACCTTPRPWTAIDVALEKAALSPSVLANLPALDDLSVTARDIALPPDMFELLHLTKLELRGWCSSTPPRLPATLTSFAGYFEARPELALEHLAQLRDLTLQFLTGGGTLAAPPSLRSLTMFSRDGSINNTRVGGDLPIVTGATQIASIDLRGVAITRAHLASLASARHAKLHMQNAATAELLDGFALESLDLFAHGVADGMLAKQRGLRRLRSYNLMPEHVPDAPLEEAELGFPYVIDNLIAFVARMPVLRTLKIHASPELAVADVPRWTARMPEQLEHFELQFSPEDWGTIRHLVLVRHPETRRWRCDAKGKFDPIGRAVLAAFGVEPPAT